MKKGRARFYKRLETTAAQIEDSLQVTEFELRSCKKNVLVRLYTQYVGGRFSHARTLDRETLTAGIVRVMGALDSKVTS